MKGLPPSLRRRYRYIAFEVISECKLNGSKLFEVFKETMLSLFGEMKPLGLELKYFDGRRGILRCYREALKDVKFGLNLVSNVENSRVVVVILGVGGTIKSCLRKFIGR
ncbi:MAG: ribonuclease P [Archaeoglobales archaeon]|nr:MAG: ribonuclease P [Archaeoglobales archaeon]